MPVVIAPQPRCSFGICRLFCAILVFSGTTGAWSAPTNTTAPATDLSSPLAAAKSLFLAISHGDRDAIRLGLYAADSSQAELADSMADFIAANKRLGDVAKARFGKAGDPIGRGMLDPADLSRLDHATIKQSDDTATVQIPEQPRPMTFHNQNGQWKLVVTDFAGSQPDKILRQTQLVSMMAQAVNESAQEISAGKYATPEQAITAIQSRLHGVMLAFTHPPSTTRATTSPAK
jgi:hypothetical protein